MLENVIAKKFPNLMTMNEKVELIIPSTVNVNEKADTQKYVNEAKVILSDLFGGATTVKAEGSYLSNDGNLVLENVTKVYAFAEKISEKDMLMVLQFVEKMKIELKQECTGMEVNGKFYLV